MPANAGSAAVVAVRWREGAEFIAIGRRDGCHSATTLAGFNYALLVALSRRYCGHHHNQVSYLASTRPENDKYALKRGARTWCWLSHAGVGRLNVASQSPCLCQV
jgi:hypothetical protein